jgi:predicted nucleotidyltransferase
MAPKILSKREVIHLIQAYRKKLEFMKIPVVAVYLYGSFAKGNPRADSDIDLCVISPYFQDRVEGTMTLMKLRSDDELLISPIAFSPENFIDENPLAWEVKQTGSLVPA